MRSHCMTEVSILDNGQHAMLNLIRCNRNIYITCDYVTYDNTTDSISHVGNIQWRNMYRFTTKLMLADYVKNFTDANIKIFWSIIHQA